MITENNNQVKEWFPLKNGNIMVKLQDLEGVIDSRYCKKIDSQPCHLGFFKLTYPKRLMNGVILTTDGFKNNKVFHYSETNFINIHKNDYDILKTKDLNGKRLFQSKNDYSDAGFLKDCFYVQK